MDSSLHSLKADFVETDGASGGSVWLPPLAQAVFVVAALVSQALLLSLLFDLRSAAASAGWWRFLGHLGSWLPLLAVVGSSCLLVCHRAILEQVRSTALRTRVWALVLGAAAYVAVLLLSGKMLGFRHAGLKESLVVVAWMAATLFWLVSHMRALVPLNRLGALARSQKRQLAMAFVVGLSAYALAKAMALVWSTLAPLTLSLAALWLALFGQQPWLGESQELGLSGFVVRVAPVCSGLEGMALVFVLLGGFSWVLRKRLYLGRALLVTVGAVIFSFILNTVRIAALVALGAAGHAQLAVSAFHSKAGWVLFSLVSVCGVALLLRSPYTARERGKRNAERAPASVYVLPLVALTAVALVTSAFAQGVDKFYGLRLVAGLCLLAVLHRELPKALGGIRLQDWYWGLGVGAVGFVIWLSLYPSMEGQLHAARSAEAAWLSLAPSWRLPQVLLRVFGAALVIPLVEELAFRGYLLRRIGSTDFEQTGYRRLPWQAWLGSSVAFGLVHGAAWLPGIICGLLFAWACRGTGRLSAGVIAHGTTNLILACFVLGTGRFDMW